MMTERPVVVRAVFLILGLGFTALAFIGITLPVLPTVPFLLLAVACFARSSARLERWLLTHRHFGPLLSAWHERGVIPLRAKIMAAAGCALGFGLFVWRVHHGPWPIIAVAALILFAQAYVWSRPSA